MTFFGKLTLFVIYLLFLPAANSEVYSNKFLMKAEITSEEAKFIAEKYGFIFHKQVLQGYFVLKRKDVKDKTTTKSNWKSDTMRKEYPKIKSIKQERYLETTAHNVENEFRTPTEFSVTDPYWENMWHLHPDREPNMGVYKAWSRGYTGIGVTLAFIDSGVDLSQTDLRRNYVAELAYDYLDDDGNPLMNYTADESSHGTQCAGIAVAEKNNSQCIVGIAHDAKFTNLRILGDSVSATYSDKALAFTHHLDDIDVYSNSWGQSDTEDGGFQKSPSVINDAFKSGVYNGRKEKGVIYTFSSGNGGPFQDCNLDIYVSNIYTIAVNSVAYDGSPADYAETCTAVMISAFGGSLESGVRITTTDSNNACTTSFSGTSAACPMVTGIIALTLQANPELTWRDIQHLIIETATTSGLKNGSFVTNGSGRNVSLFFGFGLINADAMISRALKWTAVPPLYRYESSTKFVNRRSYFYSIQSSTVVRSNISHIEQIKVWIKFKSSIYRFVSFSLTSPSGTENIILKRQMYSSYFSTTWTSITVHCWGENPNGEWTLTMSSTGTAYLYEWRLYIYGTLTDPLLRDPKDISDGSLGSPCYGKTCWPPHSVCNNVTKVCVCENGNSESAGFCTKDGDIGALCGQTHHCTQENSVCNKRTGTCECDSGYRASDGKCIKDGEYGGRCSLNGTCTDNDITCNSYLGTCVKCSSNSHKIENRCIKDGYVGGVCLQNSSCFDDEAFCDRSNDTCVSCPRNFFTILDGKCVKDGSLGGICDKYSECNMPHTYCNSSTNTCVCRTGFNESTGSCNMDGLVGGKCLSDRTCFDYDAFCETNNGTCVRCPGYDFTVVDGKCVKDGTLGGFCSLYQPCVPFRSSCNSQTCECQSGYSEVNGFCKADGYVGGRCLMDDKCFGTNIICNRNYKTCVSCPKHSSEIDGKCSRDYYLGGHCILYCRQRNAYCSYRSKCECRTGFKESSGNCLEDMPQTTRKHDINTVCDGRTKPCVKNSNSHNEFEITPVHFKFKSFTIIIGSIIVLVFVVLLLYKCLRGRNQRPYNRPVYV